MAREAAGNPLFLCELARAAERSDGALPRTVVAAVELELAALAPAPRLLVEGAAVAGDSFTPELAATAAGTEPDPAPLDALVASDLVRLATGGRTFAFRHPLVRRAVYDAAPPAWRLGAHERVAAALERQGAAPAALAHHVARSARPGDEHATRQLVAAAASAAATAPASAAHWYGAALALLRHDDVRRPDLLGPMALALANAGRLDDSHAALVEVLELVGPRRLDLVTACARVELQLGRQREARRRLTRAIRGAPAAGQAAIAFELAADAMTHGRSADLRSWAERARTAGGRRRLGALRGRRDAGRARRDLRPAPRRATPAATTTASAPTCSSTSAVPSSGSGASPTPRRR